MTKIILWPQLMRTIMQRTNHFDVFHTKTIFIYIYNIIVEWETQVVIINLSRV